jgi:hypothetical protein
VLLAGDSHSAHWLDAFDTVSRSLHFRLVTLTKSSCPPEQLPPIYLADASCPDWQRNLARYVVRERPDLVVLSANDIAYWPVDSPVAAYGDAVARGWASTLRTLTSTVPVVVLGDVPIPGKDPARCLARHVGHTSGCTFLRTPEEVAVEAAERRGAAMGGALFVPTSPWLCGRTCAVQAGNVLVWRDARGHLTPAMSRLLAPRIGALLRRALP